jgi:REP element-mobilizing transposase RayT
VSSAKYRRVVISKEVEEVIIETCEAIELRFEIKFLEVGTDKDHVHFLVQTVPDYSVTKMVRIIKSIIAREVFSRCPEVKEQLWGGEFWGKGYFTNTVGQHGTEKKIADYVRSQGREKEYRKLKSNYQLEIF